MSSGAKIKLAILASGTGSNADKICSYFANHPAIEVALILTNRSKAGVLHFAEQHHVHSAVIPKSEWSQPEVVLPLLAGHHITHIVLAGFLLLLPDWLIEEYKGRIVNIHPALLPKYGGKGMHGMHVHEKVKEAGENVSGITIHHVDEQYDNGDIIFQKEVALDPTDSAADIANKVLKLEHEYYPKVIEETFLVGQ